MRGVGLRKLDRYDDARVSFSKAIALKPHYADALRSRSEASLRLEDFGAALADAGQARALDSGNAEAYQLCADALAKLGRADEALENYDRAIALKPGNVEAVYNRAIHLLSMRRFEEAVQGLTQVLELDPDCPYARGSLVFGKLCVCDWRNLDGELAAVRQSTSKGTPLGPFHALVLYPDEAAIHSVARAFAAEKFPPAPQPLWKGERYRHDRIRVAYLSGNFHAHAVARLMAGVFEHHDRERFQTFALSFGPDDKSAMRRRLTQAFEHFIDIRDERVDRTAQRLRDMEIDIAVDLMGFTEECRPTILPHRVAPVQVNYLGYAATMGENYIDYIIADKTVVPDARRAHYTENVVHLPYSYLPGGGGRPIAERAPSRGEAGLPDNGFVFCAFHHVYKITPGMFDLWMRLLREMDGSVLWLAQTNASAAANLRQEAQARGVAGERLVFADFVASDADHLARLTLADLFLDALPYNAHATACDALWAGVPVLSVVGETFSGRVGASLLQSAGLGDMIAPSPDSYETMALEFARNKNALQAVKDKLMHNRETSALFDTLRFTRDLERAYTIMWERSQNGLAPQSFAVAGTP
jgi:predicted O-linked N-acetylglucosamine transferase (SPINDLY family)